MNNSDHKTEAGVIWLTGLSCAGKTTIALSLERRIKTHSCPVVVLDGDEIREKLRMYKFDESSREYHNLYVAYLASVLEKLGNWVIVSLISPYVETRNEARTMCSNFIEVYVSTSLETCMNRDLKGIYRKAITGELKEFTGISSPYYPPLTPELIVDNDCLTADQCSILIENYCFRQKNLTENQFRIF